MSYRPLQRSSCGMKTEIDLMARSMVEAEGHFRKFLTYRHTGNAGTTARRKVKLLNRNGKFQIGAKNGKEAARSGTFYV